MMRAANRFEFLFLAKPSLGRVPLTMSCTGLRLGHHPKGRLGLLSHHQQHQSFIRTYLAANSKQLEDTENAESNEQVVVEETATEYNSSAEATIELSPEEEEMKRGEAYDRWLTMLRQELRNIESQVLLAASSSKPTESQEERLSASDELTKLQELFRAAPEEEEELKVDLNFSQQAEGTIVFGEDHKKPLTMPYLLLDPRWYKQTTEDERVQQVLNWNPFTARFVAAERADKEFREDPFTRRSQVFNSKSIVEKLRRQRLQQYLTEELVVKHTIAKKADQIGDMDSDDPRAQFSEQLDLISEFPNVEQSHEIREPEVSLQDRYRKPPGFMSPSDMIKFSEEKMHADSHKQRSQAKSCIFCRPAHTRPSLDPMNVPLLLMFMTGAGDILSRRQTGNCRRHQRKLSRTIKRSKHMGIFEYKRAGFTVYSPFHPPPVLDAEDDDTEDEDDNGNYNDEDYEFNGMEEEEEEGSDTSGSSSSSSRPL